MTGTANLIGTPYYNTETRTLSFPDLDYTLDSDQFLLTSANFLAHSEIRDKLREKFTIELGDRIDQLKGGLEELLNRRNGNVQLHGTLETGLLGVSRRPGAAVFTAYLSATVRCLPKSNRVTSAQKVRSCTLRDPVASDCTRQKRAEACGVGLETMTRAR
jgi:hypothetical protein